MSGYEITEIEGKTAIRIDESAFAPFIINDHKGYRILRRLSDQEKFFRTQNDFCLIEQISETSSGDPVLIMVTIPDGYKAMFIKDQLIINSKEVTK